MFAGSQLLSMVKRQYILVVILIIFLLPFSLVLPLIVAYALRHLFQPVDFLFWNQLVGDSFGTMFQTFWRDSSFEFGLSVDFQKEWFLLFAVVVAFVVSVGRFLHDYLLEDMSERMTAKIRSQIAQNFLSRSYLNAVQLDQGFLASLVGEDAKELRLAFTRIYGNLLQDILLCFFYLLILVMIDLNLFLLILAALLPIVLVIRFANKKLKKLSKLGLDSQSQVLNQLMEKMSGWSVVRTHHAEDFELKRFDESNNTLRQTWRRAARAKALTAPMVEWFGIIAMVLLFTIAFKRVVMGNIEIASLTSFLSVLAFLSHSGQSLIQHVQSSKKGLASWERIFNFLREHDVSYDEDLPWVEKPFQSLDCLDLAIAAPDKKLLLTNLSFSVKPGDFIVFRAPSGFGKSTLFRVLLDLESPVHGTIRWNGGNAEFKELTALSAVMTQEPFLIEGSLLANVVYPRVATGQVHERQRVEDALKRAQLSKSLLTDVSVLSGGEKQRLMIARAFFRQALLWFMDESTSALDEVMERRLWDELRSGDNPPTILCISHRPMAYEYATQVIDLENYSAKKELEV